MKETWYIDNGIVLLILFISVLNLSTFSIAAEEKSGGVGNYIYWDSGINLTGPKEVIDLEIGGKVNYDFGYINTDSELQTVFPHLDGSHDDFRRLSVSLFGHAWDILEFKFEIDFANAKDIKDQWLRFTKGPIIPHFTFGHMKEPFSLDMLTSSNYQIFMEFTLPTRAFTPFRNFGVTAHGTWYEERMTWAAGFFLNTGSYSSVGDGQDQVSDANGYDLAGRITVLPIYHDAGNELVHLGLSYLHRFRDDDIGDPKAQLRTRPESRLTDDRLIDTAKFYSQGQDLIGLEFAWVEGPFSLQAEYFHDFIDSRNSLNLNGWYLQGSWILSGETRKYQNSGGVFAGITPENEFRFDASGWGAVEVALRVSQADLNDEVIKGGKELNFTAGFNWYLRRKIRFMVNYIHAKVEDRAEPYIENGRADIIMSRFQVNF